MPFKTGIQVVQEVRQYYAELAAIYPDVKIVEPRFVINSAFYSEVLKNYIKHNKIDDHYEKPIPFEKLRELV